MKRIIFWFMCLQNVEVVVDKVKQTNMVSEYRAFLSELIIVYRNTL